MENLNTPREVKRVRGKQYKFRNVSKTLATAARCVISLENQEAREVLPIRCPEIVEANLECSITYKFVQRR